MATDFLSSVIEAYNTGARFNPEVMRQEALGNQFKLELQRLAVEEALQNQQDRLNPDAANTRLLKAKLAGQEADPLSGITYTAGGLADVSPTLAADIAALATMDPNVRPESAVATPVSLRLGPGGQPTGFQFDPTLYKSRNLEKASLDADINAIVEGKTRKSYAPGTYVANQEELENQTGFQVPDRAQKSLPLNEVDTGTEIILYHPLTGVEEKRFPKEKGARYQPSPGGLVKITKDANGKEIEEVLPGTGPIRAQTQVKLNDADANIVDSLSKENAKKISIMNQLLAGAETFKDPSISNEIKVVEGARLGKILNSTEGKDALQEAERTALLPFLDFGIGNLKGLFDPTKKVFGRNLPAFEKQLNTAAGSVNRSIDFNNKYIDKTYQKYGQRYTPESALDISSAQKSRVKKPLSSGTNFPTEEAARAAGFRNGNTVIINGVPGTLN